MPDVGIENEIISIVITMLVMINMALNKSKVKTMPYGADHEPSSTLIGPCCAT